MRAGAPYLHTFPLYDQQSGRAAFKTGIAFSTGQVTLSQDGAAFANATNLPTEIGSTGIYGLQFTAAEMAALVVGIRIVGIANVDPFYVPLVTDGAPSAAVVTNGGNTATSFATGLTQTVADFWKYALLEMTTGSLAGQVQKIANYAVTNGVVTLVSPLTGTPTAGDRFAIVNR